MITSTEQTHQALFSARKVLQPSNANDTDSHQQISAPECDSQKHICALECDSQKHILIP
jgi:hypothetical protein